MFQQQQGSIARWFKVAFISLGGHQQPLKGSLINHSKKGHQFELAGIWYMDYIWGLLNNPLISNHKSFLHYTDPMCPLTTTPGLQYIELRSRSIPRASCVGCCFRATVSPFGDGKKTTGELSVDPFFLFLRKIWCPYQMGMICCKMRAGGF